jgi:hypothetical protein
VPAQLVPFVAAIWQRQGLALLAVPGLEADDCIASLVSGLRQGLGSEDNTPPYRSSHANRSAAAARGGAPTLSSHGGGWTDHQPAAQPRAAWPELVVASGDSDFLQLLHSSGDAGDRPGGPAVGFLQLRQLSSAASAQAQAPLAIDTRCGSVCEHRQLHDSRVGI